MSVIQCASLMVLVLYLLAFFAGSQLAAHAAGRLVWLFGSTQGRDRLAAAGFRASFALALIAPVLWGIAPGLSHLDPLWMPNLGCGALPGHLLAIAGAMLAFAAQMAMGASWRVGVRADAVGDLVVGGLYTVSRNPTFVGQAALLFGVALSVPTLPGAAAVLLFIASAQMQIRSEEAVLKQAHGAAFDVFAASAPRWIGIPGTHRKNTPG